MTMGLVDNIKREAQGNKTKIQSSDAAALEKIFNAKLCRKLYQNQN